MSRFLQFPWLNVALPCICLDRISRGVLIEKSQDPCRLDSLLKQCFICCSLQAPGALGDGFKYTTSQTASTRA